MLILVSLYSMKLITQIYVIFLRLNVKSYESDMSFAVSNKIDNIEYSGTNLSTLFSQKKNY